MVISSITQNISAMEVLRQMRLTEDKVGTNITRLSTGLRINSPSDDPGDMVTLNKMNTRIRSLDRASLNSQTAMTMAATATSALSDIIDRAQSIRSLAISAANTGASDLIARAGYQADINQLVDEMDRIVSATTFNGKTPAGWKLRE